MEEVNSRPMHLDSNWRDNYIQPSKKYCNYLSPVIMADKGGEKKAKTNIVTQTNFSSF